MSIDDAWTLYLEPGGKSVENRNRIVELMYEPARKRLTDSLREEYVDAMNSELGFFLVNAVDTALIQFGVTDVVVKIASIGFTKVDFPFERDKIIGIAETQGIAIDECYTDRQREAWKTGPDSAVDDPTIRFRPISAALIAAEKRAEAAGAASILVRESIE